MSFKFLFFTNIHFSLKSDTIFDSKKHISPTNVAKIRGGGEGRERESNFLFYGKNLYFLQILTYSDWHGFTS